MYELLSNEQKELFDIQYETIIDKHIKAYYRYKKLKRSNNDLIRGIAFATTTNREVSTKKVKSALKTTYQLTKSEDVKVAIKIIDEFIQNPLITIRTIDFITNKNIMKFSTEVLEFDLKEYLISEFGSKYIVYKKIKRFLNSAHPFKEIHIENSLQLHLASLYCMYFKNADTEDINKFVNTTTENIVIILDLDIEFPNYELGNPKNLNLKVKTMFNGLVLFEINQKNDRKDYIEDELYEDLTKDDELFKANPKKYFKDLLDSIA